jgi:tagatose-6-phosphate ketose/aldose isomerase
LPAVQRDPVRRFYEIDLIAELRSKKLGYLVGIHDPRETKELFDETIPAIAPHENDVLRAPYEIVGTAATWVSPEPEHRFGSR